MIKRLKRYVRGAKNGILRHLLVGSVSYQEFLKRLKPYER